MKPTTPFALKVVHSTNLKGQANFLFLLLITTPCLAMDIQEINPALLNPEGLTFEQAAERLTGPHAQTYRLADMAKVQSWIHEQEEKHARKQHEANIQILKGVAAVSAIPITYALYKNNPIETLSEAWFYGQATAKSRFIDGGLITGPAILSGLKVGGSIAAPVVSKISMLIFGGLLWHKIDHWIYGNMRERHKMERDEWKREMKKQRQDLLAKFETKLKKHKATTSAHETKIETEARQARENALKALQMTVGLDHALKPLIADLATKIEGDDSEQALVTLEKIRQTAANPPEPKKKKKWKFWKS